LQYISSESEEGTRSKDYKKTLYKKGKSGEKQQGHFLCVFMGQANKKGFLVCVCVRKSAGKVKEGGG